MRTALLLALALLAVLGAGAPAARAAVPREFFGVMADGPLLEPSVDLGRQAALMRDTGVGAIRLAVYWSDVQPAENRPPDWSSVDRVFAATAGQRLRVMPILLRSPAWASGGDTREGAVPDAALYARFCALAVARYGSGGAFWHEHPELAAVPVRSWQVWNEPDQTLTWVGTPWPQTYLRILRAAHAAIKATDPSAQVVAAGLTNVSWIGLAKLYRAGARGAFDAAAVHPFSRRVSNVLKIVTLARKAMRRAGDGRTPLVLSEVTWSSGKGHSTFNYGWELTEAGQAAALRDALPRLVAARRRLGVQSLFWYTWLSPRIGDATSFAYGGLQRVGADGRLVAKPALRAYRQVTRASR